MIWYCLTVFRYCPVFLLKYCLFIDKNCLTTICDQCFYRVRKAGQLNLRQRYIPFIFSATLVAPLSALLSRLVVVSNLRSLLSFYRYSYSCIGWKALHILLAASVLIDLKNCSKTSKEIGMKRDEWPEFMDVKSWTQKWICHVLEE